MWFQLNTKAGLSLCKVDGSCMYAPIRPKGEILDMVLDLDGIFPETGQLENKQVDIL